MDDWKQFRQKAFDCVAEGDLENAIAFQLRAVNLACQVNPPELALMYNSLANLYLKKGDLKSAEDAAKRSVSQELEFGDSGKCTTNLGSYYMMLSNIHAKLGKFRDAWLDAEHGITVFRLHFQPNDQFLEGLEERLEYLKANAWRS